MIGPAAGILGCVQALEVIKYFTGCGELLTGKMYVLDTLTMRGRIAAFPKPSLQCRVCGPYADIRQIGNIEQYR